MLYSESYKKQVVRKVLSSAVVITGVARKLNIDTNTIHRWKKIHAAEVQGEELAISSKAPGAFNDRDKYAIAMAVRALGQDKRGRSSHHRPISEVS